jgi:hypothetical protein
MWLMNGQFSEVRLPRLYDGQTVHILRKIAWASGFCYFNFMSNSPFLMFPCLKSCLCLYVSGILQTEDGTKKQFIVCLLQTEYGNGKLPFVCCKRKQKTEVCFPWSADDNRLSGIFQSGQEDVRIFPRNEQTCLDRAVFTTGQP